MKPFKHLILLIVLLAMLLPIHPVHADMAPPPAPLLTGLEPFEYANTKVQMVYERVELNVQDFSGPNRDGMTDSVLVTASFLMRNQGTTSETMQSIFPTESLTWCGSGYEGGRDNPTHADYSIDSGSFEIKVDGVTVPTQPVTTPHPYKDKMFYSGACAEMSWIGFNVTFPVNTDVMVIVKYTMKASSDTMKTIDYVLETGAGWYGPIKQADIVARFPYAVSHENILDGTTAGYQMAYNEIIWSYKNIEPTNKDNMRIAIVSPTTWNSIQSMRKALREDPTHSETWANLIEKYQNLALAPPRDSFLKNPIYRNISYYKLIEPAYQQAIAANPKTAGLHAGYASFLFSECCYGAGRKIADNDFNKILNQVNVALALDPANKTADYIAQGLAYKRPGLTFTPPATLPLTFTPAISQTPTLTPTESFETPEPTTVMRLVLVTVVQTRIVTATPANTAAPSPTLRPSSTPTLMVAAPAQPEPVSNWLIWPLLLIIGFVGGALVMRRPKA